MKIRVAFHKHGIFWGVFLFIVLWMPKGIPAYDFYGWSHGASDYGDALQEAKSEDKPFILYFHTEWCKWSKKMNDYYLDSYNVKGFLEDIPKVEINPDKGVDEKALCRKYRVTGYPSFLVSVPSIDSQTTRIYPFKKYADWTTDEFIRAVREKIGAVYNQKGFSCYQRKQYDEAIAYYDKAVSFNPEDVYSYYGKGIVLHTLAHQNQDSSLLEETEAQYLKALEIDPDHPGSKKELEKVIQTMEKLGIR